MKLLIITLPIAAVFFCFGLFIGYEKGVYNQLYYDAPIKTFLYSSVLANGKEKEFLQGLIQKEKKRMESLKHKKSKLLMQLPIHKEMLEQHEFYSTQNTSTK